MQATKHAETRWLERFPTLDMEEVFAGAHCRIGRKTRQKLRAACPAHEHYLHREFHGRYFRMARVNDARIIFVVAPPDRVITVFDLNKKEFDHEQCIAWYCAGAG